jgi:hypothetical protein
MTYESLRVLRNQFIGAVNDAAAKSSVHASDSAAVLQPHLTKEMRELLHKQFAVCAHHIQVCCRRTASRRDVSCGKWWNSQQRRRR